MSHRHLPVAVTIGDPAGIGAIALVKAIDAAEGTANNIPITIFGDARFIRDTAVLCGCTLPAHCTFVDLPFHTPVIRGSADTAHADTILQSIRAADTAITEGTCGAMVTLPVNKAIVAHADPDFFGHTEYLGRLHRNCPTLMLLASTQLRIAVVTTHIPLRAVAHTLTTTSIQTAIDLLHTYLVDSCTITAPRIAVLGLNPHAGDNGLLGDEEEKYIRPAIEAAQKSGIDIDGPIAADGLFAHGDHRRFDGILAMYHDQGLIIAKYAGGAETVNITLGLPYVRTSPDHGTAYTLAHNPAAVDATSTAAALCTAYMT